MASKLPSRPNLDHLRRQAKALLADLSAGNAEAVNTFREHLPSAAKMTAHQVLAAGLRLADAQSAIARKSGFESWPRLARHVETLRSLEGTWLFESLQLDGTGLPAESLRSSRILIDGDRFRTESPEATYEGVFNIDVDEEPHQIDIEFVAGPEAGNQNRGIFRVDGDRLEFCLNMGNGPRPTVFAAPPRSGNAYEVLRRDDGKRPSGVTGGAHAAPSSTAQASAEDVAAFEFVPSEHLARLEGKWSAVKIVRDGQPLPGVMLKTAHRTGDRNEVVISVGGRMIIHARIRVDAMQSPAHIDYLNLDGVAKGSLQRGIMKWHGSEAWFCMGAPGQDRPSEFASDPGSGRTLSVWKRS